jgi:hypothetical protein
MKKVTIAFLISAILSLFVVLSISAQTEQLTLKMSRDWGYGGLNGDIQGLFSMRVSGPGDLARVEFFIDDLKIGEIVQAPFNLQFSTDNYPLGFHRLYAIGYTISGTEYRSKIITTNFVPKQSTAKVIIPVFGVILLAVLLSAVVPFLASRGKRLDLPLGAERNYGIAGGAVCPKCKRPYRLPFLSMNMGFKKLSPCPFCGKWSLVRVRSIAELRQAEKAELEWGGTEATIPARDDETLRKELDDSKYQGL